MRLASSLTWTCGESPASLWTMRECLENSGHSPEREHSDRYSRLFRQVYMYIHVRQCLLLLFTLLVDGTIVVVIPSLVPSVLPRYQSQQMVFRYPTKSQIFHPIIPKTTCLASIAFPQIPQSLAHSMHVNASSCCATQEISTYTAKTDREWDELLQA